MHLSSVEVNPFQNQQKILKMNKKMFPKSFLRFHQSFIGILSILKQSLWASQIRYQSSSKLLLFRDIINAHIVSIIRCCNPCGYGKLNWTKSLDQFFSYTHKKIKVLCKNSLVLDRLWELNNGFILKLSALHYFCGIYTRKRLMGF